MFDGKSLGFVGLPESHRFFFFFWPMGMFSSPRMHGNWQTTLTNKRKHQKATWEEFVKVMQQYSQPTESLTLKIFQFCSLAERRITASLYSTLNVMVSFYMYANSQKRQIIVPTLSDKIREEALKTSWNLEQLK